MFNLLPAQRIASRQQLYVTAARALPTCPTHRDSLVRRYRTPGPKGPGLYPQCVPADGSHPHLLAWPTNTVRASARPAGVLSHSETEVLEDAAEGMTVLETARSRFKGTETVKTQRRSILIKLGARNMTQAVAMVNAARDAARLAA
jgi:DNA-binding CsgD family transcriptional regulator